MTRTSQSHQDLEDKVVDLVQSLINSFRGKRKMEFRDIGSLYFMGEDHPTLKTEGELVWQILDIIHKKNPQISTRQIFSSLISEIVGQVVIDPRTPIPDESYEKMARDEIRMLLKYSASRDIDIPLVGITLANSPLMIGKVAFHSITQIDWEGEWWEKIEHNYSGDPKFDVISFGRIISPGDWEIALNYAERIIQQTLLVIRAIGFPLDKIDPSQFGVINDFSLRANRPIRLEKPSETVRIDSSSTVITRLGRSIKPFNLERDLLNSIGDNTLKIIDNLLVVEGNNGWSKMENKLLHGLRWIGEATKPDALPAKYLKLATALEFLIGGDPSDEFLATRGITATLAERAAFLLGENGDHRREIDRDIKSYYGKRSKIIHGSGDAVLQEDFAEFGSLVRQIAFVMCDKYSEFKTIDDLQKWVTTMRYS